MEQKVILFSKINANQKVRYVNYNALLEYDSDGCVEVDLELAEKLLAKYNSSIDGFFPITQPIPVTQLPKESPAPEPEIESNIPEIINTNESETEVDITKLTVKELKELAEEVQLPKEEWGRIIAKKELVDYISKKLNG